MKSFQHKKIASVSLVFLLITVGGCKKTFDINHDPNNPPIAAATPKLVFPVAVMAAAGVEGGDLAIIGGILGEYVTQAAASGQYKNIDQYDLKTTDLNAQYTTLYTYGLKNFQFIIDNSKASGDWNFYLLGNVMKAYSAALLVDIYDQIPFSEGLQGSGNLTPKFDDGYSIYKSLIAGIDDALGKDFSAPTVIDLNATEEGNVDIIFNSDMDKWKQFANTLELKLYLRMINAKPAEAEAGVAAVFARSIGFLEEDAQVTGFSDNPSESNPLYEQNVRQLNIGTNLVASTTFGSYLQAHSDPRLADFFAANTVTLDQGDFLNTSNQALSATVFKESATDPVVFLSKAESYFLQAEGRERYYAGLGAKSLYDNGVIAAFDAVGEDGVPFIEAGGAYEYPATSTGDNLNAIITQKWASFAYGVHFIEGWFERTRTGIPKSSPVAYDDANYVPGEFVTSKNSVLGGGIYPKRFVFPDAEISTNPNTPAQVPITVPVWWGL
ncbi:MAG: SusD/RagB family nutrient-binding outer membrane lipoprotein [Ginsengibacter sp.]